MTPQSLLLPASEGDQDAQAMLADFLKEQGISDHVAEESYLGAIHVRVGYRCDSWAADGEGYGSCSGLGYGYGSGRGVGGGSGARQGRGAGYGSGLGRGAGSGSADGIGTGN